MKNWTEQGDTTGCLRDYSYFKEHHKTILTDLSKQQAFDVDPEAIEQIDFTGNLQKDGNTLMYLIFEEAKEKLLWILHKELGEYWEFILLLYNFDFYIKLTHYDV